MHADRENMPHVSFGHSKTHSHATAVDLSRSSLTCRLPNSVPDNRAIAILEQLSCPRTLGSFSITRMLRTFVRIRPQYDGDGLSFHTETEREFNQPCTDALNYEHLQQYQMLQKPPPPPRTRGGFLCWSLLRLYHNALQLLPGSYFLESLTFPAG